MGRTGGPKGLDGEDQSRSNIGITVMFANLKRMRAAVQEWLTKEEILGDAHFYSIEEWNAREEPYLGDSLLVLVFDGSTLHTMLNYGGDTEEFDDLIDSFGFWYELGHSWNMGFYAVDEYDYIPIQGTYAQKLRDPRWVRKAELVKKRAEYRCQDCGMEGPLDAHHCYYAAMREGYQPWEYPLSAFRALCRTCHSSRELAEIRMRAFSASLTQTQLDKLREAFKDSSYWFETDAVLEFLSHIGHDNAATDRAVAELKKHRNDTL